MLVGLGLVQLTGETWIDPVVALMIAVAIVYTGLRVVAGSWRVLVDEALPDDETAAIREAIEGFGARGVVGYHELRTRRAGPRRYVDVHVQFRSGTTLEDAHAIAHELQDTIRGRLRGADVLIHLEPEDRVRPGEEIGARAEARKRRTEGKGRERLRPPRTASPTQPQLTFDKPLTQVDPRRDRDGQQHPGVPEVARQQEQHAGDEADGDGGQPGDSGQRHRRVSSHRA